MRTSFLVLSFVLALGCNDDEESANNNRAASAQVASSSTSGGSGGKGAGGMGAGGMGAGGMPNGGNGNEGGSGGDSGPTECLGTYDSGTGGGVIFLGAGMCTLYGGGNQAPCTYTVNGTAVCVTAGTLMMCGTFATDCSSVTFGGLMYMKQ